MRPHRLIVFGGALAAGLVLMVRLCENAPPLPALIGSKPLDHPGAAPKTGAGSPTAVPESKEDLRAGVVALSFGIRDGLTSRPVAGALLTVERDTVVPTSHVVTSDDRGIGQLLLPIRPSAGESEAANVRVTATGYHPYVGTISVAPRSTSNQQLDINLEGASRLWGIVQSDDHAPIPNATIIGISEAGRFSQSAGSDGRFEIGGLRNNDKYTIVASAPSYEPSQKSITTDPSHQIDFVLRRSSKQPLTLIAPSLQSSETVLWVNASIMDGDDVLCKQTAQFISGFAAIDMPRVASKTENLTATLSTVNGTLHGVPVVYNDIFRPTAVFENLAVVRYRCLAKKSILANQRIACLPNSGEGLVSATNSAGVVAIPFSQSGTVDGRTIQLRTEMGAVSSVILPEILSSPEHPIDVEFEPFPCQLVVRSRHAGRLRDLRVRSADGTVVLPSPTEAQAPEAVFDVPPGKIDLMWKTRTLNMGVIEMRLGKPQVLDLDNLPTGGIVGVVPSGTVVRAFLAEDPENPFVSTQPQAGTDLYVTGIWPGPVRVEIRFAARKSMYRDVEVASGAMTDIGDFTALPEDSVIINLTDFQLHPLRQFEFSADTVPPSVGVHARRRITNDLGEAEFVGNNTGLLRIGAKKFFGSVPWKYGQQRMDISVPHDLPTNGSIVLPKDLYEFTELTWFTESQHSTWCVRVDPKAQGVFERPLKSGLQYFAASGPRGGGLLATEIDLRSDSSTLSASKKWRIDKTQLPASYAQSARVIQLGNIALEAFAWSVPIEVLADGSPCVALPPGSRIEVLDGHSQGRKVTLSFPP